MLLNDQFQLTASVANSLQVCLQILLQNTTDLLEGFGFDIKKDNQIELSIAKCQIQFRIITSLAKKKYFAPENVRSK